MMRQGVSEPRGTSKTVPGKPLSNCRFTQVGDNQRNKPCIENQSQIPGSETAPRLEKSSWRTVKAPLGGTHVPGKERGVAGCDLQAPAHRRLRHKKS
jgi:hypothetical protein